jgi:hypothetical protein
MVIITNKTYNQSNIEITKNENNCVEVKVGDTIINNMCTSVNLELEAGECPRLKVDLIPNKVLVKIGAFVEFEHNGKIYRLVEII